PDRLEAHHFADAVDMAGHEMAAEPIGQGHRLLEIDLAGRIQADRKAEALARDIHIEAVVGQRDDRHAGALDGDRVADADVRKVERAGLDLQAHAAAAPDGLDLANAPYRGNDSGEHGYLVTGLSFGASGRAERLDALARRAGHRQPVGKARHQSHVVADPRDIVELEAEPVFEA